MIAPQALTRAQSARLKAYLAVADPSAPPLPDEPSIAELVAHPLVRAPLLGALDCQVPLLMAAGAGMSDLTQLEYGARHLVRSPGLCSHMVAKFGATAVAVAMLKVPEHAVELAGSALVLRDLNISTKMLLTACQGDTASAVEVIRRLLHQEAVDAAQRARMAPIAAQPSSLDALRAKLRPGVLHGVPLDLLVRLGFNGQNLNNLFGITLEQLGPTLGVSNAALAVLGVYERA